MAILSFWSNDKKQTGQTLSIVAVATYMSVERNYRTLVIDATYDDDTMERCFWPQKTNNGIKTLLNSGKIDFASGTKGLMNAAYSNKITPETIPTYAKVVYNKRLDILLGVKNQTFQEYAKSFKLYKELILAANKFYDLVIVDMPKTSKIDGVTEILGISDVLVYTMSQNLKQIDYLKDNKKSILSLSKSFLPFLGNVDLECKYNPKNVASYLKSKNMGYVLYNNSFLENASEAKVSEFFLRARLSKKSFGKDTDFINVLSETSQKFVNKLEELKYGI